MKSQNNSSHLQRVIIVNVWGAVTVMKGELIKFKKGKKNFYQILPKEWQTWQRRWTDGKATLSSWIRMRLVFIWRQWKPHFLAEMLTDWAVIHANQGSEVPCLMSTVLHIQTFSQGPCKWCMSLTVHSLVGVHSSSFQAFPHRDPLVWLQWWWEICSWSCLRKFKLYSWISCAQQRKKNKKKNCLRCWLKVHELGSNCASDGLTGIKDSFELHTACFT